MFLIDSKVTKQSSLVPINQIEISWLLPSSNVSLLPWHPSLFPSPCLFGNKLYFGFQIQVVRRASSASFYYFHFVVWGCWWILTETISSELILHSLDEEKNVLPARLKVHPIVNILKKLMRFINFGSLPNFILWILV